MTNRIIKFRAWDKQENKFYVPTYEAYRGELDELVISFGGRLARHTIRGLDDESTFPDRYVLMQFTGLLDKNGKEIYEGDIVNSDEYPFKCDGVQGYLGVVEWFEEDLCWSVSVDCVNDNLQGAAVGCGLTEHKFEVIGNIYESPGLLTK